jgi:hypothetical protein
MSIAYGEDRSTRRCPTCSLSRWWLSRTGAVICHHCHPHATDALAALIIQGAPGTNGHQASSAPVSTGMECPCQQVDVEPAAVLVDHHEVLAFLRDQPAWWRRGLYGFRPPLADPAAPSLWVFSRPAKAAFEGWRRARGLTR